MKKLFRERGYYEKGRVLPFAEFRPFRDLEKGITFCDGRMSAVLEQAEKYVNEPIPMLPLSLYREFQLNGNRSHYEGPYFQRRDALMKLAVAECYEKKGRFTAAMADYLWAILEESTWVLPAHQYNHSVGGEAGVPLEFDFYEPGIDLFAATTAANLATVLYLCREELDGIAPQIAERVEYELERRIVKPFLYQVFWWMGVDGRPVNNWNPWIISNVLTVAAFAVTDPAVRERLARRSMILLDNYTKDFPEDGGCDEGPSYWGAAGACYMDCLELLYDLSGGSIDVYDSEEVRAMAEYIVKVNIDGVFYVNFADGPSVKYHSGCRLARFGRELGSEQLLAFGRQQDCERLSQSLHHFHPYATLKDLCSPLPTPVAAPVREKQVWFKDLKVAVLRQCEQTDRGLFVAFKGGHNGESHNHNDLGHFVVYADGKPLVIDPGAETYCAKTFSPQRYELWFMNGRYHSLPTFDGADQRDGKQYASRDEAFDPQRNEATMELAGAYAPEAGVRSFVRSVRLQEDALTVTDRLALDREQEVEFHLMLLEKPTATALADGSTCLTFPCGRTLTLSGSAPLAVEIEELPQTDNQMRRNWGQDVLYRLCARVRTQGGVWQMVFA